MKKLIKEFIASKKKFSSNKVEKLSFFKGCDVYAIGLVIFELVTLQSY